MIDYAAKAARAADLIARFGAPAALNQVARQPYDPASSSADPGATRRTACQCVRIEYSLRERDTGLIDERDAKLLISARGVPAPSPRDTIEFAGSAYEVIESRPLAPAGVAVLYEVQGRKV